MNKIFQSIATFSLLVLLISFAMYFKDPASPITGGRQCELDDTLLCRFTDLNNNAKEVIVKFANKVQVEEQNDLRLTLPADMELQDIWIQGVNMYMGKVAVFKLSSTQAYVHNLQFFLGSCSEQNMRWQMVIVIKKASVQQPETYFINFKTKI